MLTLDSLVEISKNNNNIWLISTSFILISKPLKHNTTKTKDSTWRFAHEEKPWFTASVLLVLSITPISTQKIWDNTPTYSIDLEKPHSHPGMCVHLICAGHEDVTPAFLLQAEKHYNIKPSTLWEKKNSDVMWFTHFRSFPMCPWGEDVDGIFDGMEYSHWWSKASSHRKAQPIVVYHFIWQEILLKHLLATNKLTEQVLIAVLWNSVKQD